MHILNRAGFVGMICWMSVQLGVSPELSQYQLLPEPEAPVISLATPALGSLFLEVSGKLTYKSGNSDSLSLTIMDSETQEVEPVTASKGKFHMSLKYHRQFLLIITEGKKKVVRKKILVSTSIPIGSTGYKIKMVVDMDDKSKAKAMGIMEFNGFENRFTIRSMTASELKRRRFEFESLYSQIME